MASPGNDEEILERSPQGNFVKFDKLLGKGAFKSVFRGQDVNNGNMVAWNEVNVKSSSKRDKHRIMFEIQLLKCVLRAGGVWGGVCCARPFAARPLRAQTSPPPPPPLTPRRRTLHHTNLLAYYGGWVNKETEKVVFVTELMSSGTLRDFAAKYPIPLKTIKKYCREILQCMDYLHTENTTEKEKKPQLIHRDLKCDNIFINAQGKSVKIGDLGLVTKDAASVMGTPEFMAPGAFAAARHARAHTRPLPPSRATNPLPPMPPFSPQKCTRRATPRRWTCTRLGCACWRW